MVVAYGSAAETSSSSPAATMSLALLRRWPTTEITGAPELPLKVVEVVRAAAATEDALRPGMTPAVAEDDDDDDKDEDVVVLVLVVGGRSLRTRSLLHSLFQSDNEWGEGR